jgi:hypothetical protein
VGNVKSAALFLIFACALTIPAHADTIIVTNTNDNGPGSLRQALAIANAGDTIDATGISGVITLTTGELLVGNGVTINGAGADALAVDGNAASAVFHVRSIGPVTISDLTIKNGQGNFGGGILNGVGATLTITNSTLSGNMAAFGGGIFIEGTLTIANSTVSDNMASEGGGTYNSGNNTLTITNSTFSGNAGPATGGAVFNIGAVAISDSTVSGNSSGLAGGVFNIGTLQIGNTILNAGDSGANIANNGGTVTSHGYNLSSDDGGGFLTGPGDQINTDPLLGPLQDNGGPTFTHALLPGSPAIGVGVKVAVGVGVGVVPACTSSDPTSQNRAPAKARSKRLQVGLRKMSAQIEASKPASQVVNNPQKLVGSWDCVSAIDSNGRTSWIADAH